MINKDLLKQIYKDENGENYARVDVLEGAVKVDLYNENDCDFLMATPPCQGMSVAGKMKEDDPRNSLIIYTIEFIKKTKPS